MRGSGEEVFSNRNNSISPSLDENRVNTVVARHALIFPRPLYDHSATFHRERGDAFLFLSAEDGREDRAASRVVKVIVAREECVDHKLI